MVGRWKQLSEEVGAVLRGVSKRQGRQHYIELAEQDRLRFEKQPLASMASFLACLWGFKAALRYEEWRSARAQQGKNEPLWQDLVEKRRSTLERCLTRRGSLKKAIRESWLEVWMVPRRRNHLDRGWRLAFSGRFRCFLDVFICFYNMFFLFLGLSLRALKRFKGHR